ASLTATSPSAAAFCAARTFTFCSRAMRIASLKEMMRAPAGGGAFWEKTAQLIASAASADTHATAVLFMLRSFVSQGLNGIQRGRLPRRVEPEEHADRGGKGHRDRHCLRRSRSGPAGHVPHDGGATKPDGHADE